MVTPHHHSRRFMVRVVVFAAALAALMTHTFASAPEARSASVSDRLVVVAPGGLFAYALDTEESSDTATVSFGSNGDQPLMGDWDCDGTATPGVYRNHRGRLFLSNGTQTGRTDVDMYYGNPGDTVLVGDFNGDGCDTIAVWRPLRGEFHIRNTLTSGFADKIVHFGNPGDRPFVGDFDGDGKDTFGVFRRGIAYLTDILESTIASKSFAYGNPDDRPFTGDWNGDGKDSLGLYRPSTGYVYLRDSGENIFVGHDRAVLVAPVAAKELAPNDKLPKAPPPPPKPAPKPAPAPAPAPAPPPKSAPAPAPAPRPTPPPLNYDVDVELYPGDDLRAAAKNAPEGTVFRINGEHKGQEVAPRRGQVFVGAPGAKLIGNGKDDAFRSSADDVVIDGIEITGYTPGAQEGIIQAMGDDWTIRGNNIHHNDGVGVKVYKADRAVIVDNALHHNEQLGVSVAYSRDSIVDGNEIAYNNWNVKYSWGWEAGGTKFWSTHDLVVRDNWSHHNHGPGLWTDHDNVNTLFEENLVEDNYGPGIFHEISYSATIRNNVSQRNGFGHASWLWGAGIVIAASQDVDIYGNEIVGNHNGITLVQQDRGSGDYGPYIVRNNHVHDNRIVDSGKSGAARDVSSQKIFDDNNRFTNNDYVGDVKWEWVNKRHSWSDWQGFGHDVDGSYKS